MSMKVLYLFAALYGAHSKVFFDKSNEISFLVARGSSAHAEIDPPDMLPNRSVTRLLRPRGDRPDAVGWLTGI